MMEADRLEDYGDVRRTSHAFSTKQEHRAEGRDRRRPGGRWAEGHVAGVVAQRGDEVRFGDGRSSGARRCLGVRACLRRCSNATRRPDAGRARRRTERQHPGRLLTPPPSGAALSPRTVDGRPAHSGTSRAPHRRAEARRAHRVARGFVPVHPAPLPPRPLPVAAQSRYISVMLVPRDARTSATTSMWTHGARPSVAPAFLLRATAPCDPGRGSLPTPSRSRHERIGAAASCPRAPPSTSVPAPATPSPTSAPRSAPGELLRPPPRKGPTLSFLPVSGPPAHMDRGARTDASHGTRP